MITTLLSDSNKFIEAYSYLFTFLGFVIGILGSVAGLYNYLQKRSIIRLRESVISAHLQNIRSFKNTIVPGTTADTLKQNFSSVYNHFLEMLSVVMEPSEPELSNWLNKGYIDREDFNFLIKLRLRK